MLTHLRIVVAAVLLLGSADTTAICLAGHVYEVYVGDKASDATCTYDSIQEALSATYTCATTIRVTRMHTYTTQHLTLNGTTKPLTLQGEADGVTCYQLSHCLPVGGCHAATTQPLVTIDGNNTAGSVLTITGNNTLTLRDLTITRGSADPSVGGGGIRFDGTGSLYLDTSTVTLNYAGYGGGINVNGNGGPATLTLGANSLVTFNTAEHDGGGIRLTGQARLFALQPQTTIFYNHAPNGHGGGIEVVGPARADIGSPGDNGLAVIYGNDAEYGGGISADAGDGDFVNATVRLFTTDPKNPVSVSDNSASHTGGGIYVNPFNGSDALAPHFGDSILCASDFRIDNNIAQEGSGIYADEEYSSFSYYGATVRLNGDAFGQCSTPETTESLGGVRCAAGTSCNTISGNVAEDSSSNPTAGSAILAQTDVTMQLNRVELRANQGAHVIRSFGSDPSAGAPNTITNCLIADNTLTAEMIRIENDGNHEYGTTIDGCTIVNNGNMGAPAIYSALEIVLTNSIIDESGINTLNYAGYPGLASVSYVLATDTSSLPMATHTYLGQPSYVDAASHDYHLQPKSLGVDFAPKAGGQDLDGNARDVDLATIPNVFGPRDLGAYERQNVFQCGTSDSVFCNGYE
ncbi:MAG TPA: hypothetical protein VLC97_13055 [Rhodanobacteraceae bacterium]|nr:hypothetical protein [Rhodanobacteraceae bacterium]